MMSMVEVATGRTVVTRSVKPGTMLEVVAFGTVRGKREPVEDAQRFERGDALCLRRQLGDLDIAVRRPQPVCPPPLVGGDVVGNEQSPERLD